MAAEDIHAHFIGQHRMIYATNVPHYYVERPDPILYRTEQMIHGVTAQPGDRFILSREIREVEQGSIEIHFMTTRQRTGWTRETVIFRRGDPSPYSVEEKKTPIQTEEDTIRRIVIRPSDHEDCVTVNEKMTERSYWDEINADEIEADEINTDEINTDEINTDEMEDPPFRMRTGFADPYDLDDTDVDEVEEAYFRLLKLE